MRHALIVVLVSFTCGCGLVFQGTTQTLRLSTQPEGAAVQLHGVKGTSPAIITLSRRVHGYEVYQASKPGYHPACQVIDCGAPRWVKALDGIPAALPLAFDAAVGTLGNCGDASLLLEPMRSGEIPFTLPDVEKALERDEDERNAETGVAASMCAFPYLYDREFGTMAERIIVSTGDLRQPYELIGNVDFGKLGFDRTDAGAIAFKGLVWAWVQRTFSKAPPAEINMLLRKRALYQYGTRVDALINVNYQSDPANNVFATAVAVHFIGTAAPARDSAERLEALRQLREKGLIDQREYEQKRAEILRGL
jgi:hypothetical protein